MTASRVLRLTEAVISLVHREVADTGPVPGMEQFTEADYDEHLSAFLAARPEGPIHVFAYGSLIWKPVFEPAQTMRATAIDWRRAFTLRLPRFRGTVDQPGLMMQLDRGGSAEGVLQRLDDARALADLGTLWRREMTVKPPGNFPRWIETRVGDTVVPAIAFTANPEHYNYAGVLPIEEAAERIAFACGHWGSNADYLRQTIVALEAEGIHDDYLWALQDLVADKILSARPNT
jgi:cation transport protein ChaC